MSFIFIYFYIIKFEENELLEEQIEMSPIIMSMPLDK